MTGGPHLSATACVGSRKWAVGLAQWSLGRAGLTARDASEPSRGKGGAAADFW
jgi:hypothetical protein